MNPAAYAALLIFRIDKTRELLTDTIARHTARNRQEAVTALREVEEVLGNLRTNAVAGYQMEDTLSAEMAFTGMLECLYKIVDQADRNATKSPNPARIRQK